MKCATGYMGMPLSSPTCPIDVGGMKLARLVELLTHSFVVRAMTTPSPDRASASQLDASLRASLRAALWTHRDSLDTLRDAVCAFAVDLHGKGVPTTEIAAMVRDVVTELRASGERLAAELAEADPSLDQTVKWCLEYGTGPQSEPQQGDRGGGGRNS